MSPTMLASWGGPRQSWGAGRAPGAWDVHGCSTGQAQAFSANWRCQQGFQNPAFARSRAVWPSAGVLTKACSAGSVLLEAYGAQGCSHHSTALGQTMGGCCCHGLSWLPPPLWPVGCLPPCLLVGCARGTALCLQWLSVRKCSCHHFCLWAVL